MLKIRPFQPTDADYAALVTINNACWPDNPQAIAGEMRADAERNAANFFRRLVGERAGTVIAIGECGATFWLAEPHQYYWHCNVLPAYANQGLDTQMHDALMTLLVQQQPRKFFVGMRDDKVAQIRWIETLGYRLLQTESTSYLDVSRFDATPFAATLTHVEQQGIEILDVHHLQQVDPHWLRKLWDLQWQIRQDVPNSSQVMREPLADSEQRMRDPEQYNAAAHFVAVQHAVERLAEGNKAKAPSEASVGTYIGMTQLTYNTVDPTLGATHLTGVIRHYRRQSIATALKVYAILRAQTAGVRRIETMNHADNPMLALNHRLGFQPGPAWRYYEKSV